VSDPEVKYTARVSRALPRLRQLARASAKKHGIEPEDAEQIASLTAVRVEPLYDEKFGASFVTFAFGHALGAILREAARRRKATRIAQQMAAGAAEYAASIPSFDLPYNISDEALASRVDDLRFASAAALFVAISPTPTPEEALIEVETRTRSSEALRGCIAALPEQDRAAVERAFHDLSLRDLFGTLPGWKEVPYTTARSRFEKILQGIGRQMKKRDAAPESK
jgi:DNA-directed RNA polymerase specialized sigma24 family protein